MKKLIVLPVLIAALALAGTASARPPLLTGTVGPGFTITLTKAGKKVKVLKAGRYRLRVRDRSDFHDFHIKGPGLNRMVTTVDFVGTKTITIRLRKGRYTFVCDPHVPTMHGSFRVR